MTRSGGKKAKKAREAMVVWQKIEGEAVIESREEKEV